MTEPPITESYFEELAVSVENHLESEWTEDSTRSSLNLRRMWAEKPVSGFSEALGEELSGELVDLNADEMYVTFHIGKDQVGTEYRELPMTGRSREHHRFEQEFFYTAGFEPEETHSFELSGMQNPESYRRSIEEEYRDSDYKVVFL